jgi:hypothetical protein
LPVCDRSVALDAPIRPAAPATRTPLVPAALSGGVIAVLGLAGVTVGVTALFHVFGPVRIGWLPLARLRNVRHAMNANKAAGPTRGPGAFPLLANLSPSIAHWLATPPVGQTAALLADSFGIALTELLSA